METQEIIRDILTQLGHLNRNIISDEFEESLQYLCRHINLTVHHYKTGARCWTWDIPAKWKIRDAYIRKGEKEIASFRRHPLHVMSYSVPVRAAMKGKELLSHVHVHPQIQEAIPYEFSFYVPQWGFCLTHQQYREINPDETYEILIDSEFVDGYLSVGEYTVKGQSDEYIVFLCHLDHPCQVNDGLIGAAVNVTLAKFLEKKNFYYNYMFLFVPETIGSIAFLSHHEDLIPKMRYAVFNEMIGLEHPLVLQQSYHRRGLINDYARYAMRKVQGTDLSYPFLTVAGNDEKVFDSPGVGIPSISLTRVDQDGRLKQLRQLKQRGEHKSALPYPEYHSNFDNLKTVNFENVTQTVGCLYELCSVFERDFIPVRGFKGPVFLSKYDLWIDWRIDLKMNEKMMRLLYYLEGDRTAFQIAEELELDFDSLADLLDKFYDKGLIKKERIPIGFDR